MYFFYIAKQFPFVHNKVMAKKLLKQWRFTAILIMSVAIGACLGIILGDKAKHLKPLGDIFLNLIYTAVVPLIFFTISAAVASSTNLKRLGRIATLMLLVFIATGIISASVMLVAVKTFDPAENINIALEDTEQDQEHSIPQKIVRSITTPDFSDILTRRNILALIVFSVLIGIAANAAGDKGKQFRELLTSGAAVMTQLIKLIMLYAPIGLAGYFAWMAGTFGADIVGGYAKVVLFYYPVAILYFIFAFSVYVLFAAGSGGLKKFWKHIPTPAITALGTGSSLAALPANLQAAENIGVDEEVREIVLPLGATIHMDGSCLAAILKIAVLFALFDREFTGVGTFASAIGVSLLCGVVMSGIPGGGFLGEALIVSMYGFGPGALPVIAMLGVLVDPPATMISTTSTPTVVRFLIAALDISTTETPGRLLTPGRDRPGRLR